MYSSVKFFVAIVTAGLPFPGSVTVLPAPPPLDPHPARPASRIARTASAVARILMAVILTGRLDGGGLDRRGTLCHRPKRAGQRLAGVVVDRQLDVDGEHL